MPYAGLPAMKRTAAVALGDVGTGVDVDVLTRARSTTRSRSCASTLRGRSRGSGRADARQPAHHAGTGTALRAEPTKVVRIEGAAP